jgi:hypothetical protein
VTNIPVDDTPENLAICMEYCGICPSLPSPPTPFLFCARGKANAQPIQRKGCTCVKCDVYKKYGLDSLYFCESGAEP